MTQIKLEPNKTYSEEELINIIKSTNSSISDTHIKWVLFDMLKNNQITRVGCKKYISGRGKEYNPNFESTIARKIDETLNNIFPLLRIVIWETIQLNEWTNLLLSKNTIVVEVESGFESIVFDELMKRFGDKHTLLFNPNNEMVTRYMRDDLIIVKALFSRSPVNKGKKNITLEKLTVDVIADKYLNSLLGTKGVECVIRGIKHSYTINESKMFTYAVRRNVIKELKDIWEAE